MNRGTIDLTEYGERKIKEGKEIGIRNGKKSEENEELEKAERKKAIRYGRRKIR